MKFRSTQDTLNMSTARYNATRSPEKGTLVNLKEARGSKAKTLWILQKLDD